MNINEMIEVRQPAYSIGLMHDVEYKRVPAQAGHFNDTYRTGLVMQIIVPRPEDRAKKQEPYPIIVYPVGGGWTTPLLMYRLPYVVDLARRGLIVATVQYRGREFYNNWKEQVEDVRSAYRYLKKHAADYAGDPDNMFFMGDSAGGHLSMLAGYTGNEFDDPDDDLSIKIEPRGILDLFGPVDLWHTWQDTFDEKLKDYPIAGIIRNTFTDYAKTQDETKLREILTEASILPRITEEAHIPPTLITQGDRDAMVATWNAAQLYEKLTACGKEAYCYLIKDARHGDTRFYTDEMFDRYEAFIRTHLTTAE